MDRKTILGIVLVLFGAVLAPRAELRGADTRSLQLTKPMIIEGIYLRASVYDVRWELQGLHATVTFSRKGRAIATVQGDLSTMDRSSPNDTLYFSKQPDGCSYIQSLGFAKTNRGIVFPAHLSRSHASINNSAVNSLMENTWSNHGPRLPLVYK
jgi:hypothetical protein